MGRFADRRGRRAALTLSVSIMAAGSLVIALVPTYARIGIWSPVILIVTRLIQGFSLGGEYGTSATYMSEMASPNRRGFYSSFQYVTLIGGQLSALLVQIFLQAVYTSQQLYDFAWRIPFAIGAVGAMIVLWLRLSMEESDQFKSSNRNNRQAGTLRLLAHYPKQVLTVVGMTLGGTISFYTYTTYLQQFMIKHDRPFQKNSGYDQLLGITGHGYTAAFIWSPVRSDWPQAITGFLWDWRYAVHGSTIYAAGWRVNCLGSTIIDDYWDRHCFWLYIDQRHCQG